MANLNDIRLNKSGTVGTEPIAKNGNRYTEVKLGKLGAVDVPASKSAWRSSADGMMKAVGGVASKVANAKKGAEDALQNYGKNIAKNMGANSAEFEQKKGTKGFNNYQTKNPFPNPLKKASYK